MSYLGMLRLYSIEMISDLMTRRKIWAKKEKSGTAYMLGQDNKAWTLQGKACHFKVAHTGVFSVPDWIAQFPTSLFPAHFVVYHVQLASVFFDLFTFVSLNVTLLVLNGHLQNTISDQNRCKLSSCPWGSLLFGWPEGLSHASSSSAYVHVAPTW